MIFFGRGRDRFEHVVGQMEIFPQKRFKQVFFDGKFPGVRNILIQASAARAEDRAQSFDFGGIVGIELNHRLPGISYFNLKELIILWALGKYFSYDESRAVYVS